MLLSELLKKRANGEQLTEEELEFLNDYDKTVAVYVSDIEKLKTEKESYATKFDSANQELQDKLKVLTEKEKALQQIEADKQNIEKILANAKSAEEARLAIEKDKAEREKREELKRLELEAQAKLELEAKAKREIEEEQAKLKRELDLMKFEKKVLAEKIKRPYLEKQLDKILVEIPTKELRDSELYFNFLIDMVNHEDEMKKWKEKQEAGTDIFSKRETKIEDKQPKVDPKYGTLNVELGKKYGLIGR